MRRLFTIDEMRARGFTRSAIRWGEKTGRWRAICRGVWGEGPDNPSDVDRARAAVIACGGIACGKLAAFLHGLDSLDVFSTAAEEFALKPGSSNWRTGARRRLIPAGRIIEVAGVSCTDMLQTLLDLAVEVDDIQWEQVLETLMVQLVRTVPGLSPPVRQFKVFDTFGNFVARVDLAWPELGLFLELDGQHHKHQPVYDAHRQTVVGRRHRMASGPLHLVWGRAHSEDDRPAAGWDRGTGPSAPRGLTDGGSPARSIALG